MRAFLGAAGHNQFLTLLKRNKYTIVAETTNIVLMKRSGKREFGIAVCSKNFA
jgi:hypothetical protein